MIFYYEDRPKSEQPSNQLEFAYRDFKVRKTSEYDLYSIVPPEGKIMRRELQGDFSSRRLIETQIDGFLANHQNIDDAFVDAEPPKPKRGRPPKSALSKKIMEVSSLS